MKMHMLNGGRLRMRKSVYVPGSDRSEMIDLPVLCTLLRHPQGNVLFDTGCHPSVAADAQGRWGDMAKSLTPVGAPDVHVVAELARLALTPDDIDVVINSHLHSDHCGCNEYFKRATVLCHRRELDAAGADNGVQMGYIPADWQHPMPVDAIDAQRDLYGDGKIVLLPLPGHTPGSIGALIALERDGPFLLAADAAPLRLTLDQAALPRNTRDPEQAAQSLDEIRRIEAAGTQIVFGHDDMQWAQMRKGADAYE